MKNSIKKFSDALDKSAILLFITTLLTTAFIGLIVVLLVTKGIIGTYDPVSATTNMVWHWITTLTLGGVQATIKFTWR